MKIAFVETHSPWLVRQQAQVSLGPLYLATILNDAGHDAIHRRLCKSSDVLSIDSDVVAFGGTTLEWPSVKECATMLLKYRPEIIRWYGGPHATALPDRCGNLFHSLAVGEAESFILDLARDAEQLKAKRRYLPTRQVVLDDLPYPDRSLVDGSHGGDIFAFGKNYIGEGNENIIASRGCSYACAFCASQAMWSRKVRFRSVDNLLGEVDNIIETTGCRQLRFADDHFASSRRNAKKLCQGLGDRGVAWRCSVRADALTSDLAEAMVAGGCREVSVGIESGDQRVLDFLDKRTDLNAVRSGCQIAEKTGLAVRALLIAGAPGEFPDSSEHTIRFMEQLACTSMTLSTFIPFPGTSIWNDPDKYDCEILTDDFSLYNKDLWIRGRNGVKALREYRPLIMNRKLTAQQQKYNVQKLEEWIINSGKGNLG